MKKLLIAAVVASLTSVASFNVHAAKPFLCTLEDMKDGTDSYECSYARMMTNRMLTLATACDAEKKKATATKPACRRYDEHLAMMQAQQDEIVCERSAMHTGTAPKECEAIMPRLLSAKFSRVVLNKENETLALPSQLRGHAVCFPSSASAHKHCAPYMNAVKQGATVTIKK